MRSSLRLCVAACLFVASSSSFSNAVSYLPDGSFIRSLAGANGNFYRIYETPDPTPIDSFNKKYVEEVSSDGVNWVETNPEPCNKPNSRRKRIYATSEGFYRFYAKCPGDTHWSTRFSVDGITWETTGTTSVAVIGHKNADLFGVKRESGAELSLQLSSDRGQTWAEVGKLPVDKHYGTSSNSDLAVLDSGAMVLISGKQANHNTPVNLLVSTDGGANWQLNPTISINGEVLDYSQHKSMELVATNTKVALAITSFTDSRYKQEVITTEDGVNWKSASNRYGFTYSTGSDFYDFEFDDGLTLFRSPDLETYSVYDTGLMGSHDSRYRAHTAGKLLVSGTNRTIVIDDFSQRPSFTKFKNVESIKNASGDYVWVAKAMDEDKRIHVMAHSEDGVNWEFGDVYSGFTNGGAYLASSSGLTKLVSSNSVALAFTQKQPLFSLTPDASDADDCIIRSYSTNDGVNWQWSDNLPFTGCLIARATFQDSTMSEAVKNPIYLNGKFIAKTFVDDTVYTYSSVDGVSWTPENSEIISAADREFALYQYLDRSFEVGDTPNSYLYSRGNQLPLNSWYRSSDGLNWDLWSTMPLNFGNANFTLPVIGSTRDGITALQLGVVVPDGATLPTDGHFKFYRTIDDGVTWKGRAWPRGLPQSDFDSLIAGNGPVLTEIIHAEDEKYQVLLGRSGEDTAIWYSNNHGESWGHATTLSQFVPPNRAIGELIPGQLVLFNGENRIHSVDLSGTYVPPVVDIAISPDKKKQKLGEGVEVSASSESGAGVHEYTLVIKEVIAGDQNIRVYPEAGENNVWQTSTDFSFVPSDLGLEVGKKYRVIVKVRDEQGTKNRATKTIRIIN